MIIEPIKDLSEAAKNVVAVINSILEPKGIDAAIVDGHKKIIEGITTRNDLDDFTKMAILSGYKKMIREHQNCTEVVEKALSQIRENAEPSDVDTDWFNFFFDKIRLVSDEETQLMWSRILAGEVNSPGTYSRSLLHTLSIMSKSQAQTFCNMTRFCLKEYKKDEIDIEHARPHPLLFVSANQSVYETIDITAAALLELENLGLIHCNFSNEYIFKSKKRFRAGNKIIEVFGDNANNGRIQAGNVIFTDDGRALYSIVGDEYKRYSSEILDYIITKWERRNCTVLVNGKKTTTSL